jgi:ketosteroid isomerase-like protein
MNRLNREGDAMTPMEATRQMYDLVGRGEWAAVAAMMAEDFVIHEPETLPYGGRWEGRDALQRLFARVMGFWQDPKIDWIDLTASEHHAVALLALTVTAPASGQRFTHRICEVTRFGPDGKLAEMHIHYFDTGAIARHLAGEA